MYIRLLRKQLDVFCVIIKSVVTHKINNMSTNHNIDMSMTQAKVKL